MLDLLFFNLKIILIFSWNPGKFSAPFSEIILICRNPVGISKSEKKTADWARAEIKCPQHIFQTEHQARIYSEDDIL